METQKKGQTRMFETIGVLVIFFVLLGIGIIFYGSFTASQARAEINEYKETRAIRIAKSAVTLPELSCSKTQQIDNCFDRAKIKAFREFASDTTVRNRHYYDIFKDSTITIEQIYPDSENFPIYSRPKATSKQSVWMPITIYDPQTDSSGFGIIKVDVHE